MRIGSWSDPSNPPEITDWSFLLKFPQLEYLEFSSWNWGVLPLEISQLSNLTSLELINIPFKEFPTEIAHITRLKRLQIIGCQLTSLPPELFTLRHLEELYFSDNQITELPIAIGNLGQLMSLCIAGNPISSLPCEIGLLTKLRLLNIHVHPTKISELPLEMINCTQLEEIGGIGQTVPIPYNLAVHWSKMLTPITLSLPPEMDTMPNIDVAGYSYLEPPRYIIYPIETLFQDLLAGRHVPQVAYPRMFNEFTGGMKTHLMTTLPRDHPFLEYLHRIRSRDIPSGYSIQL